MKTNKTFEQAWKLERPERFISTNQVYNAGWNAALASVVEEPVLTEMQIRNITLNTLDLLDWANNATTQGNAADHIAKALLSAGRIPASKPAPQQEGGLTPEEVAKLRKLLSLLA